MKITCINLQVIYFSYLEEIMNDVEPWAETPEQFKDLVYRAAAMVINKQMTEAESQKWIGSQIKDNKAYLEWVQWYFGKLI